VKLRFGKFCRVGWFSLGILLVNTFLSYSSVFAQTTKPEDYLLRKKDVNTSSTLIIQASEREIKTLKETEEIIFSRRIDKDNYIVVPNGNLTKQNISIVGNANDKWKQSINFENNISFPGDYAIEALTLEAFLKQASQLGVTVLQVHPSSNTAIINIGDRRTFEKLLGHRDLVYIKPVRQPKEESPNPLQDLSVNKINAVHAGYPFLTGEGLAVSVKERTIDTMDLDLKNRFIKTDLADDVISLHANQIATIIAGGGNSRPSSKGIAYKSAILSSSYNSLLPDDVTILKAHSAYVQNHSYGTNIENFYGPEAKAYDALAVSEPYNLNVFSSGNSGLLVSPDGTYQNIAGYANLTGNMKMAKNVLVVGGLTSLLQIDERNSNGPAYDGRVKPELVAFGPEGTSDAAAFASGVSVLLQQKYLLTSQALPTIDLMKAILIASADDVAAPGVDHKTGYGSMNALKAVEVLDNSQYFQAAVQANNSVSLQIEIPAQVKKIVMAITWIDPPANAGDEQSLANDLDVVVTTPSAQEILPWVLSDYPHPDSLAKPARRGRDHLNNCEFITIDNPTAGLYAVNVTAEDLIGSAQNFSLAYAIEYENSFRFTYPTSSDAVNKGQLVARWDGSLNGTGRLEASFNNGDFLLIDEAVNLEQGLYSFTPEFSGEVQLRMTQGSTIVVGDKFIVSEEPAMTVGFVCDNEVMIQWSQVELATSYNIYTMGDKYLELFRTVADTVLQMSKDEMGSDFFAVEPLIGGLPGYRSLTYDVTSQGVQCYYKQLYGYAKDDVAYLQLRLSTRYNVSAIRWQRKDGAAFELIGETTVLNKDDVEFTDQEIPSGVTEYKAVIVLKSGEEIETESVRVYYANEFHFFLFPNPVEHMSQSLSVLTDGEDLLIYFYDNTGRLAKIQEIVTPLFYFPVDDMKAGFYLYRIKRGDDWVSSGKILLK
jgi:hypothetical protein